MAARHSSPGMTLEAATVRSSGAPAAHSLLYLRALLHASASSSWWRFCRGSLQPSRYDAFPLRGAAPRGSEPFPRSNSRCFLGSALSCCRTSDEAASRPAALMRGRAAHLAATARLVLDRRLVNWRMLALLQAGSRGCLPRHDPCLSRLHTGPMGDAPTASRRAAPRPPPDAEAGLMSLACGTLGGLSASLPMPCSHRGHSLVLEASCCAVCRPHPRPLLLLAGSPASSGRSALCIRPRVEAGRISSHVDDTLPIPSDDAITALGTVDERAQSGRGRFQRPPENGAGCTEGPEPGVDGCPPRICQGPGLDGNAAPRSVHARDRTEEEKPHSSRPREEFQKASAAGRRVAVPGRWRTASFN